MLFVYCTGASNNFCFYFTESKERLFGIFPVKDFIHYPLAEDPMFHGITESNRWQSDDVFVQQRLAGLNPMSLRRASAHGMCVRAAFCEYCAMWNPNARIVSSFLRADPVLEFLNTSGSWGQILEEITGESFNEVIWIKDTLFKRGVAITLWPKHWSES